MCVCVCVGAHGAAAADACDVVSLQAKFERDEFERIIEAMSAPLWLSASCYEVNWRKKTRQDAVQVQMQQEEAERQRQGEATRPR